MYGAAHAGFTPLVDELSQSSLHGQGVVALTGAWPVDGLRNVGLAGHGPALLGVDFIQLSKIRGAANGKVETSRGR
jgi:hypothetical protein